MQPRERRDAIVSDTDVRMCRAAVAVPEFLTLPQSKLGALERSEAIGQALSFKADASRRVASSRGTKEPHPLYVHGHH